MKHNLLFAVVMITASPFFVAADNGILSSSLNLGGDDLSIAAYCQNGDDYLVEEVYSAGSNEPNVYSIISMILRCKRFIPLPIMSRMSLSSIVPIMHIRVKMKNFSFLKRCLTMTRSLSIW